ncbi:MAG: glycosyltransferase [Burkholderiales bacterium]|nr:glycosyltransferase [Burkholderiales bacterium]MBK8665224.1 glycosyltransferase [Burkholderiales bacterium]
MKLSIIVPTFNERDNILILVSRIEALMLDISYEIIFVDDDSADETWSVVDRLARVEPTVRRIRRIGRRGLASAVIEGCLSSSADLLIVMDADLQHDEKMIPEIVARLSDDADIVVVSRDFQKRLQGLSPLRQRISRLANYLLQPLLSYKVMDPMSGFFGIRGTRFGELAPKLSPVGFKILFDLISIRGGELVVVELVAYFGRRIHGESKLKLNVFIDLIEMYMFKIFGRMLPLRLLLFLGVGALGAVIHLIVLKLLHHGLSWSFVYSQLAATYIAMMLNFINNNLVTYRDHALSGRRFLLGAITFILICSVGAAANVAVASYLYDIGAIWWIAGLCGAIIGSVWNYSISRYVTWGVR